MNPSAFLICAILMLPAVAPAATPPAPQIRALWVDGFHAGFRTPEEADKLVADATAAHLNLLIVQVRRRGDSFYTKSIEPPVEDDPYKPDFDALGYLLDKAHAAGMQVHAWVNVTPIWRGGADPPKDPKHVFNVHGLTAQGADNWLTETYTGEKKFSVGYFLDPGHPAAARYIASVIMNIVRNYPIDGIHLDYVRYPEIEGVNEATGSPAGYNPVSVARFHARYGGTDLPKPNDAKWSAWRREQVTNLVRRIYASIHEIKPEVALSAAVIPWGDGPVRRADWPRAQPYWRVFQDWLGWLDAGFLDMAVPMNYDKQSSAKARVFYQHWIEFEKNNKHGRLMVVGLGAYMNTVDETRFQLKRAQARSRQRRSADGYAIYSYYSNAGFLDELAGQSGATPPLPPQEKPRTGTIFGVVPDGDGAIIEISRKGVKPVKVIADGNGYFAVTGLKPGVYRVKSRENEPVPVAVEAGKTAHAFDAP